jgi:hypothetical protein
MIHYVPEGHHIKLGLNFSRSSGGFRLLWAWYNFATREAFTYRFRFRWHMAPRFIWNTRHFNVIDSYLEVHQLALVHREVLEDLKAAEEDSKALSDRYVRIKPN